MENKKQKYVIFHRDNPWWPLCEVTGKEAVGGMIEDYVKGMNRGLPEGSSRRTEAWEFIVREAGSKKRLTLVEYEKGAMSTCMMTCSNWTYSSLGLMGEVGELMGKVAKWVRHGSAQIVGNELVINREQISEEDMEGVLAEAGDCLWMLTDLVVSLGSSMEDVAKANLEKLASRKQRGKIEGDGDKR